MRTAVIVLVVLIANCCAKPKPCPTLPVRPVSEPVVTVVAERPPCALPELPQPIPFKWIPLSASPDEQQGTVSKMEMAALAVYLAEIGSWIISANACLE